MFKSEADYQNHLIDNLESLGWVMQVHDDKVRRFIPDLSFAANGVDGWIEVKWLKQIPKTIGHIDHFTRGQEDWLKIRGRSGSGHAYLWIGSAERHWVVHHSALGRDFRSIPFEQAMLLAKISAASLPGACSVMNMLVVPT